ncbi:9376_t:CDS:2, partial [Gigaspora margarita]
KHKKAFMNQENSINSDEDSVLINSANITDIDIDASSRRSHMIFVLGWALQKNLKANQKDSVKQLTEKVKGLLGAIEIEHQDVPKVFTISNWIKRTSQAVKQ